MCGMKKILFIITKSEMGGAQRFLYELAVRLDPEKYDITVAAGGNGDLLEKLLEKNIKTVKIRNFSNIFSIKNALAFWEIFRLIWKIHPQVIYLLSSEAGFLGSFAGSFYKLFVKIKPKIIYRIGGWAFKEPKNIVIKKIYLWAEKLAAPFKDVIVVNSEFDLKLGIKNCIVKPDKIVMIYNGIDIHTLKFLPRETARQLLFRTKNTISKPLIGTIANLYKNKGLEYLVLTAEKLKNAGRNWQFMIIGDGPERPRLENLIKKHGLENYVILTGAISDAHQYLKAFDLFVLPSVKEGQPWAILEAMAAKRPIVAANIAGIPEMIKNEKSGLLVEPADPVALASAIEKIMLHPSLAHECVTNAFEAVKTKFGIKKMVSENEKLF